MRKRAFTLLEALAAVVIVTVAVVGLLLLFINVTLVTQHSNNLVIAVSDAQHVLEEIKSEAFDNIDDYSDNVNEESDSVDIDYTIAGNIARVTVNVGWYERGTRWTTSLSTCFVRQ